MVDCGKTRCSQLRRTLRRDLVACSKKLPLTIGLEEIASSLLQDQNGSHEEKYSDETLDIDWMPLAKCCFCGGKTSYILDLLRQSMKRSKSPKDHPGFRYIQQLQPFCYPPSILPSLDKIDDLSEILENSKKHSASKPAAPTVELKVPQFLRKRKGILSKEEEENSKITTTSSDNSLVDHNQHSKMLKSELLEPGEVPLMPFDVMSPGSDQIDPQLFMNGLLYSTPYDFMPFLYAPGNLAQTFPSHFCTSNPALAESDLNMQQIRKKHDLHWPRHRFGYPDSMHKNDQYGFALSGSLPFMPDLIRRMVHERMEKEQRQDAVKEGSNGELDLSLPTRKRNHQEGNELKIPSFMPSGLAQTYLYGSNSDNYASLKNNLLSTCGASSNVGETLKDIIAKTIADKMRLKTSFDSSKEDVNVEYSLPYLKHDTVSSPLLMKHNKMDTDFTIPVKPASNAKQKKNKKTRPKRGQYRKYNSQLLIEAVKAVQRGEMSVHRAGTYFGVPHSTLEYKVKERHLLRQKKFRDPRKQAETSSANKSQNEEDASNNNHDAVNLSVPENKMSSTHQSGAFSTQHEANPSIHDRAKNSAFPPCFAINTSASELLKKLQRKVQSKSSAISDSEESISPINSPSCAIDEGICTK